MSSLAISADGKTLATVAAPGEGTLRLWNIAKNGLEPTRVLDGLPWAPAAIAFSRDGKYVAAGTGSGHSHPNDGQILVWDLRPDSPKLTSNVSATESPSKRDLTALLFTANDGRLVSADQAGFIRNWKLTAAGELKSERKYLAHENGVTTLHETGSGQLISSGNDGTIASWDMSTGKLQRRWNFASQSALLTMAPSGEHCAVGLADGRVYILQLSKFGE